MFLGFAFSLLMGVSLGLIGGGGSILTVPILVYFFKVDGTIATADSMFVVGATALVGALLKAKRHQVDFKSGVLFALPSFGGVLFARKVVLTNIPDKISLPMDLVITKSTLLLVTFAVLMIGSSYAMITSRNSIKIDRRERNYALGVGFKGFFVGCITGFVGAGGGFLIVPALALLLNMPMRLAIGTSLAIIAANSLFGFLISLGDRMIDWRLLLSVTALGLFGFLLGHSFSDRVSDARLKKAFGYFILIVGTLVLGDQLLGFSR